LKQNENNFFQGTKAAVAGGTTFVIDCVMPENGEPLMEAYNKWRGWADEKVCCDYALRVAVNSADAKKDMEELTGADFGVNTFWFDMAAKGVRMNDVELMAAMAECGRLGCLAQVHPESGDIVDRNSKQLLEMGVTGPEGFYMAHSEAAEEEATMRATALASQVNCPLYVSSMSSAAAAEIVRAKKSRGNVVYGETTAASLACDGDEYFNSCWRHAAAFVTRCRFL
jgi:dihydropyrimidinase